MSRRLAAVVVSVALLAACRPQASRTEVAAPPVDPATLPQVVFPSGKTITVELALTPEDQGRGLMFRESLAPGHGMLFVFDEERPEPFWMKNCNFPIDIAWIDAERRFVSAVYAVPPCRTETCPNYTPAGPALFVVEVGAGVARDEKLQPGDQFELRNLPLDLISPAARKALGG